MMVEPNVERILIVHPTWTGEIVVEQARTVRHWVQIGNIRTRRIDACRRDHVQLAVVADRIAELNAYGLLGFRLRINARIVASAKRLKHSACIERLDCTGYRTRQKRLACEAGAQIPC